MNALFSIRLAALGALAATASPAFGSEPVEIAPDGAWTFFNDERARFHGGGLYVGYVRGDGFVGLTRYEPGSGEAAHMQLGSEAARERDDHNNPSLTPLPDGRLLAAYARHNTDRHFFHRRSTVDAPADMDDWSDERREEIPASVTYSNTMYLADEELVYNFHRSLKFNPAVSVSRDLGRTWEPPRHLIRTGEGGTRPYHHYASDGEGRIDLAYTDGHPRNVHNSLYHFYYEDGQIRHTDGTPIKAAADIPLEHDEGERGSVVYSYSEEPWADGEGMDDYVPNGRAWIWDLEYDAEGRPVCVFQVQAHPPEDRSHRRGNWPDNRIYYYRARWDGEAWHRHFIAHAGRGLYAREEDYAGGICLDPTDPDVVYLSSNARDPFDLAQDEVPLTPDGRYEIYRGVTDDGGETYEWTAVTEDSEADNLRPFVTKDHPYARHVLWMNGDYRTYADYDTRILGLFEPRS